MRVFVVDKYVILTLVLAALIAVFIPLAATETVQTSSNRTGELPIYSVNTDEKKVAVTFNAAWNADDIDSILKTLAQFDCQCTFFAVGTWAEKYPEALTKLIEAGHEIGSHSYNHAHFNALSAAEMRTDMEKCDGLLSRGGANPPVLFRAPYGEYNATMVQTCNETGRYPVQWDIDSLDWKGTTEAEMCARIVPRLRPGSIILLHSGTPQTAAALPGILAAITAEGYTFSTVGDLIYKQNYTIDHEGRQQRT